MGPVCVESPAVLPGRAAGRRQDGSPRVTSLCLCSSGIEPQGNTVLQPAHFTVQTVDAGVGEVLVYVEDPEGHTEEV